MVNQFRAEEKVYTIVYCIIICRITCYSLKVKITETVQKLSMFPAHFSVDDPLGYVRWLMLLLSGDNVMGKNISMFTISCCFL